MKLFPTALSGGRHRYCTRWSASCLSKRSMSSVCHCSRKCAMAACWPQHMLATKRRCCCVSQPEADKQTDSRPAAVAMRVCVCGGGARLSGSCFDQRLHHEYSWYTYSQQPAAGHIYRHTHTLNDGNNGYKSSPEPPPSRSYFEFTFKAPLLQSERARQGVTSTCWNPHINVLLGSVFCYLKSLNFVGFFPGFVCQATHRLVLYSLISQDNPSTHTAPSSC